ncbi:MAG TPA: DUF1475 family protein [bacterium]|nr:DUF1475 family protein [bacterium]
MRRHPAVLVLSVIAVVLLAAMLASFLWAGARQALGDGFAAVTAQPWGLVTLLDLYVGFAFVAVWIYVLERNWLVTLGWAVALCVLGNVTTLVYLLLRARKAATLADVFMPARAPR